MTFLIVTQTHFFMHTSNQMLIEMRTLHIITIIIWCRGQKPPTLMPTDCSVLRTPTILPNIRISWDYHPTFMLISGRVLRSFAHLWASSCGLRPFDPGIIIMLHTNKRSCVLFFSTQLRIILLGFYFHNQHSLPFEQNFLHSFREFYPYIWCLTTAYSSSSRK